MIWIYALANLLVDSLSLLGLITKINPSLLALTILSWGNAVGDCAASMALSKKGYGQMAVTGCIAGPIFNLMFGLGLTTLMTQLNSVDY